MLGVSKFRSVWMWGREVYPQAWVASLRRWRRSAGPMACWKRLAISHETLTAGLRGLGLDTGHVVLVHASLRSIGGMAAGAESLFAALREVIGDSGTLVVPTFTSGNSNTSRAYLTRTQGMTEDDKRAFLESIPPFDINESSALECGQLAEHVRKLPMSVRSEHPQTSFAAFGAEATTLMAHHDQRDHLGEKSPLAKLYERKARVLLLGVDYDKCTAFHLAEYRYVPSPPRMEYGCMVKRDGRTTWHSYEDVRLDDSDFMDCGREMEQAVTVTKGPVGRAESRSFSLVEAVDFAEGWLRKRRTPPDEGNRHTMAPHHVK